MSLVNTEITFSLKPDEVTLKSIIETPNSIVFNSSLNELLGFTSKSLPAGTKEISTHISENKVDIMPTDKVHLKCDCVDGSIVNGKREPILYSFGLDQPPGYKIFNNPNTVLYKKVNKERLDGIYFYLEDDDYNPVDFNGETITFTIQLRKI